MSKTNRTSGWILVLMRNGFCCALVAALLLPGFCLANPVGSQVVHGQAGFSTQGNTLSITASDRAIINWNSFSINNNEITRFLQPGSSSSVLNRVIGNNPSAIYGALQSNGKVYLINQNGIFIGPNAVINVGGLVASTLNIADSDFKAGRINFNAGLLAGKIENQGTISASSGGSIYLIAPDIINSGIINAPNGDVLLAAGQSVHLVESATPEIAVVISAPENQALNLGRIMAEAGRVGIHGGLVKQKGIVSADSAVADRSGRIFFKSTRETVMEAGSRTSADGVGIANGGSVMALSEGLASGEGTITAKGGELGGNGGFIETSGTTIDFSKIKIDASAPRGRAGLWLIDPEDLTIDSAGASNISSALSGTDVTVMTSSCNSSFGICSGTNGDITVASGITKTSGSDTTLTLKADRSIVVNAPIGSTSGKLNVTLNSHSQDDNAPGSVGIHGNISTNGGNLVVGGGLNPAMTSAIGYDGASSADGDKQFGVNIDGTSGSAIISTLGGDVIINGKGVANSSYDAMGIYLGSAQVHAGGGNINLSGFAGDNSNYASAGVHVVNSTVGTIGSGSITIQGTGGANTGTATTSRGVYIQQVSTLVSTENGVLSIIGAGGANTIKPTNTKNPGVLIASGTVQSTDGTVAITGTAGSTASAAIDNKGTISGKTSVILNAVSGAFSQTSSTAQTKTTGASSTLDIKADTIILGSPIIISTGSNGMVTLTSATPSRTITLGDGASGLGLSTALLNTISSDSLTIGDTAHTGPISTDGIFDVSGKPGLVALRTSGGAVTLNHDIVTGGNLSIDTKGSGSAANGVVSGSGGMSIGGGTGTLSVAADGGINLTGSGNYMASFNAANSGSGDILFSNTNTLHITGITQSGSGNVIISNNGTIAINGGINVASGNVSLTASAGDINPMAPIIAPSGQITLIASDAITGEAQITHVTASTLVAAASFGIGSADYPIRSAVNSLSATNSDSGDIFIANTGALTIQTLTGAPVTGNIFIENTGAITTGATAVQSGGDIFLIAHSPLTIGTGGVTTTNGSIYLEAGAGGVGVTTDNLTLDGPLHAFSTAPPGNITLVAGNAIIENSTIFAGGTVTKSANLNPPPSCSTGYAWDGSVCAPITCPTGQQLVGNACQAITCQNGQQLVGNACQAITCPTGQQLVGNVCQAITCPTGQQLVGNACQAITCSTGQQLVGNACQAITCPTGQQLVGNVCQAITCPTGQQLVGNACQAITCPTGQQLVGNTCQAITCPTGQQLVGNVCQAITCPTGQQLVGNACQAITCPTGQQLVGNACQAITCPTGQQLVGNACQAITCTTGQQLVGNACQAITCPTGQQLVGNFCTPNVQKTADTPFQEILHSMLDNLAPTLLKKPAPGDLQGLIKPSTDNNAAGEGNKKDADKDEDKDGKGAGLATGGVQDDVKSKKNYCN